jgi:hypothetical protein
MLAQNWKTASAWMRMQMVQDFVTSTPRSFDATCLPHFNTIPQCYAYETVGRIDLRYIDVLEF